MLVDFVDDDDVLVIARRGGARFSEKGLRQRGGTSQERFDRNATSQARVSRQIDDAHSATANLSKDLVVTEARPKRKRRVSVRPRPRALWAHSGPVIILSVHQGASSG